MTGDALTSRRSCRNISICRTASTAADSAVELDLGTNPGMDVLD